MRKGLIIVITGFILGLTSIYFFGGYLVIGYVSSENNINFSYTKLKSIRIDDIKLAEAAVTDVKTGIGISAEDVSIRPAGGLVGLFKKTLDFDFRNGRFLKTESMSGKGDNLGGLVAMPFGGEWNYEEISGTVQEMSNGVYIKRMAARNDKIRLSLSGKLFETGRVDAEITVYFAQKLVDNIPKELSGVILNPGESGWKSLTVSLKGDYKSPSIQVASRLFRLNIKSITK